MLSIKNLVCFNNQSFQHLLLLVGLGISAIIYLPGLSGDFIHDDFPNIVLNQALHIDNLDFNSILGASFSSESGTLKRPISMFSFAVNHYFSGLDPSSYKITNIIIHLLVGLSLFLLTRALLDSHHRVSNLKASQEKIFYIALIITLAWLVSPINLTSVLYVVQRMTSLSALFCILGIYFYVLARRSMIFEKNIKYIFFISSGLCFLTALFCKENAILSVFYLILIETIFLKFKSNSIIPTKLFKIIFLTLAITPIVIILIWVLINPVFIINGYEYRSFSLSERVLTQPRLLLDYIRWIIAPNITELGLFHDDIAISKSLFEPISTLISIVVVSSLLISSILLTKNKPFLSFGILFFFTSHLLESSVLPLEMAYEHRNYLASFGIIFAIVATTTYAIKVESIKNITIVVCCLWCSVLAITTSLRAQQWSNGIIHSYYEALHHPKSSRAVFNLGKTYAELTMMDLLDEKEKAINLFEQGMSISPQLIISESAAITFSSRIGMASKPEWIDNINHKLATHPITHVNLESLKQINQCLTKSSCNITLNQAYNFYVSALNNPTLSPDKFKSDLLTLYAEFSTNTLGEHEIAYNAMKDAIEINPHILQYRINFIKLTAFMKKYDEASMHIKYVEDNDTYLSFSKIIETLKKNLVSSKSATINSATTTTQQKN